MPEYSVSVLFEGQGRIKVRASTEAEAVEDARQMDLEDIDVALSNIQVVSVRECGVYPEVKGAK